MADEADRSDEKIFNVIDDGVAEARRKIGKSLLPCGSCHWCGSPLHNKQALFCPDDSCHADWEYEQECRRKQSI